MPEIPHRSFALRSLPAILVLLTLHVSHSNLAEAPTRLDVVTDMSSSEVSYLIYTIAGSGLHGFDQDAGPAIRARLNAPVDVAIDERGNLYIADRDNYRIRKVTADGVITTVAGSGTYGFGGDGGPASTARLHLPQGLSVDTAGNLYVAEGNRIRKVTVEGKIVAVAGNGERGFSGDGGPALAARLDLPSGLATDNGGNLYISDQFNHRIRKVTVGGVISTAAGNGEGFSGDGGPATAATLDHPHDVAVDAAGNLYIADHNNHRIRKIAVDGVISTVAGTGVAGFSGDGGPATSAQLVWPSSVSVDRAGNLYIAEGNRLRKVSEGGVISTVAGTGVAGFSGDGGSATSAQLVWPSGVAVDSAGSLYIADYYNHRIRKLTPVTK